MLTNRDLPVNIPCAGGRARRVAGNLLLANGMGFSPDRQRFYFTDLVARLIHVADVASATGELLN